MFANHKVNADKVIYQVEKKPYDYHNYFNTHYVDEKARYDANNALRLGFIIGINEGRIPFTILDVGYGIESFLKLSSEIIKECYGYDVGDIDVPEGCHRIDDKQLETDFFDVVTFFDSLEHMEYPYEFVKKLKCDKIVISVPHCRYNDYFLRYGENRANQWFSSWRHRKTDEHLWYFDTESLVNFMNSCGYRKISYECNLEDVFRKNPSEEKNILTLAFKKC